MPHFVTDSARLMVIAAVLALAAAASGCGGASVPAANDVPSLAAALEAAGLRVEEPQPAGVLESRLFEIPGVAITASGERILAYQFRSPEVAAAARAVVSPDGFGIGSKYVNWSATPHYYSRGALLVIYEGEQSRITDTLAQAMGPRFAGS